MRGTCVLIFLISTLLLGLQSANSNEVRRYFQIGEEIDRLTGMFKENHQKIEDFNTVYNNLFEKDETQTEIDRLFEFNEELKDRVKLLSEEKFELGERNYVSALKYQDKTFKNVRVKLGEVKYKKSYRCKRNGFFTSTLAKFADIRSYLIFTGKNIYQREHKIAHNAFSSPYIRRCLVNGPERAQASYNHEKEHFCHIKKDGSHYNQVAPKHFELIKMNGYIKIKTDFEFVYLPEEANLKSFRNARYRAKRAISCAKRVFANHGIDLDMTEKWIERHPTGNQILITDTPGRSHALKFHLKEKNGEERNEVSLCGLFVHEFGHHFGLPDLYPDKKCKDRDVGSKNSIMYNDRWKKEEDIRFTNTDLEGMIGELCGKPSPKENRVEIRQLWE